MSEPIKLTDEVIAEVLDCHFYIASFKAEEFAAAIRELRDRARAVVEDATCGDGCHVVASGKIYELREVLP